MNLVRSKINKRWRRNKIKNKIKKARKQVGSHNTIQIIRIDHECTSKKDLYFFLNENKDGELMKFGQFSIISFQIEGH